MYKRVNASLLWTNKWKYLCQTYGQIQTQNMNPLLSSTELSKNCFQLSDAPQSNQNMRRRRSGAHRKCSKSQPNSPLRAFCRGRWWNWRPKMSASFQSLQLCPWVKKDPGKPKKPRQQIRKLPCDFHITSPYNTTATGFLSAFTFFKMLG